MALGRWTTLLESFPAPQSSPLIGGGGNGEERGLSLQLKEEQKSHRHLKISNAFLMVSQMWRWQSRRGAALGQPAVAPRGAQTPGQLGIRGFSFKLLQLSFLTVQLWLLWAFRKIFLNSSHLAFKFSVRIFILCFLATSSAPRL